MYKVKLLLILFFLLAFENWKLNYFLDYISTNTQMKPKQLNKKKFVKIKEF